MTLLLSLFYAVCILFLCAVAVSVLFVLWSIVKPRKEMWR